MNEENKKGLSDKQLKLRKYIKENGLNDIDPIKVKEQQEKAEKYLFGWYDENGVRHEGKNW